MKVTNMTSSNGNKVANQFIIEDSTVGWLIEYFQSYETIIAVRNTNRETGIADTSLDKTFWNYSRTTSKYRNQFLGETTKETQAKIDNGTYILTNLN